MSTQLRRALRRTTVVVLALLVLQVGTAGATSAHTSFASSSPADGAELPAAPAVVTLTFDEPVSTEFSQVSVTGPDGAAWQSGAAQVSGATVTQALAAAAPGGTYQVAWRVVSADGHPISGAFSYDVTIGPATSTSPATASPPSAAGTASAATERPPGETVATAAAVSPYDGTSWLPIAGVVIVLLIALAAGTAVVARRRRTAGGGG